MIKRYLATDLQDLVLAARLSERGRAHLNTHDALDADVQRLFIATTRNTYIRPHRHTEAHKWEFFLLIEGRMDLLLFADDGEILERCRLSPSDSRAVQIPVGQWHSYVCCQPGTLALEVKQGAYIPTADKDFAPWAPDEKSPDSQDFLLWMRTALVGSKPG
jgi:cupin fold WbuC family metalloprotein